MSARAAFCMKCGSPLEPGARFCMKCGASTPDAVTAAGAGSGARAGASPAVIARQAMSVGGTVASMGGVLSLPWQTIVAGETPDMRRLIAAGAPIAQRAVLASLRRPAIALLVTTLLDLAVALVTAQPGALKLVGLRAAMGVGTAVLGMIVGNKAGPLRQVTGAASMLTGLVQTGSMLFTAFSAAISPAGLLGLVPSIVSQASSLVMLVKTAIVSLKRPGRERHNPQTVSANAG
ncbi:MAG TPA: zinc ribbon domain-containing protein [Coriobacteriia bacterium]